MESIYTTNKISNYYLEVKNNLAPAKRRKNLQRITLKTSIVVTNNETYSHLTDRKHRKIDTFTKINYAFVLLLEDMLNVTMEYTYHPSWTGSNGTTNSTRYGGLVGDLVYKITDIGGTGLFMTPERVNIMDFTLMMTPTGSKFVFRQPKLSYITDVFTLPFDTYVWLASLCLLVVLAVSLFLVAYWERFGSENNEHTLGFGEVAFFSFGAVCQQGAHLVPSGHSGRIITILLFISMMFLYTSYSANIVALLQTSSTSIQTLKDLLHSRLQVGVDDTVYNRYFFPVS